MRRPGEELGFAITIDTDVHSPIGLADEAIMLAPAADIHPVLQFAFEESDYYLEPWGDRSPHTWRAERARLTRGLPARLADAVGSSRRIDEALTEWLWDWVMAETPAVEAARKRKGAPRRKLRPTQEWPTPLRSAARWRDELIWAEGAQRGISEVRRAVLDTGDEEERWYQMMLGVRLALRYTDSYCPPQSRFVDFLNGLLDEHARVAA